MPLAPILRRARQAEAALAEHREDQAKIIARRSKIVEVFAGDVPCWRSQID
jgi:hypothetical protein